MRILMINHHRRARSWLRAGAFAVRLAARGHEVTLMVLADTARWRFHRSRVRGIDLVESPDLTVGRVRSGWDPVCALRRHRWLRRDGAPYDLIHLFETRPATIFPGLRVRRRLGVPLVIDWIDWWGRGGVITVNRPFWYRHLFAGVETYFEEHFRARADATTVISRGLKQRAEGLGIPSESIHHLRLGVDLDQFRPRDVAEVRRCHGYDPEAFLIGFASMDSFLDLPVLFEGIRRFAERRGNVRVLVTGRNMPKLRKALAEGKLLDRVHLMGFVAQDEYPEHLAACDLLAMPFPETNYNIGRWPNKFGEYLTVGRPVVFNPNGDLAEFAEGEVPGIACDYTPQAFADAFETLYRDPDMRARAGETARRIACRAFVWDEVIDRLEALYADLTGGSAEARRRRRAAEI